MSLIEFATDALKRQSGAAIEFDDFYLSYLRDCTAKHCAHSRLLKRSNRLTSCAVNDAASRSNGKAETVLGGVQLSVA
jgi:hypothetical protein